jgi:hypothetical protein
MFGLLGRATSFTLKKLLWSRLTLVGLVGAGGWFAWQRRQQAETPPPVEPTWPPLKVVDSPFSSPVTSATVTEPPDAAGFVATGDGGWVAPLDDGTCPLSHPFKANDQSHIVHAPGQAAYERTIAERCYSSVEAAEADGYRPAKR